MSILDFLYRFDTVDTSMAIGADDVYGRSLFTSSASFSPATTEAYDGWLQFVDPVSGNYNADQWLFFRDE